MAMTIENATTNSCAARVEHRRSKRFPVAVAAEVKWLGPGGVRMKEKAHAEEVNAHGGLLRMNNYPNVGAIIELCNVVYAVCRFKSNRPDHLSLMFPTTLHCKSRIVSTRHLFKQIE